MSTFLLRCGLAIKVDYKYVKYDYSKYLGADYLKTQKFPNNISTYVSNHVSWSDIIVFLKVKQPAFASKVELKRIPVFGFLCQALGCIFIERGGSKEAKDHVIHQIQERQEAIEKDGIYPPMIVFPEGGTSNGISILPFKKGAFASYKAVRPIFLRYDSPTVSPAYDVMPFFPLYIL
jgi:lysophosphatidylcholine acyltransferase/lyso-PAF acetyltransferase